MAKLPASTIPKAAENTGLPPRERDVRPRVLPALQVRCKARLGLCVHNAKPMTTALISLPKSRANDLFFLRFDPAVGRQEDD